MTSSHVRKLLAGWLIRTAHRVYSPKATLCEGLTDGTGAVVIRDTRTGNIIGYGGSGGVGGFGR